MDLDGIPLTHVVVAAVVVTPRVGAGGRGVPAAAITEEV